MQIQDNIPVNRHNADWFDNSARRYREKALVEHDAHIAKPLYAEALHRARQYTGQTRVLDLGAGVGISTLPFLEAGTNVMAVDIAAEALNRLHLRAGQNSDQLETVCADAEQFLRDARHQGMTFDIIICRAFLHHVPDYLSFIEAIIPLMAPKGSFISLAEPTRFDTIPRWHRGFNFISYAMIRIFKGHYLRGLRTRYRRLRGILRTDLPEDNVEFHMVRNGVDQNAICDLFRKRGLNCRVVRYFGTANPLMRPLGRLLRVQTSFALCAVRS